MTPNCSPGKSFSHLAAEMEACHALRENPAIDRIMPLLIGEKRAETTVEARKCGPLGCDITDSGTLPGAAQSCGEAIIGPELPDGS